MCCRRSLALKFVSPLFRFLYAPVFLVDGVPVMSVLGRIQSLVQRHHPQLVLKLLQLGVQPLQLAMPWIQFGFVTYLEADQASLCTTTCSSSSCDLFIAPPSAPNVEGIR